MCLIFIAIDQHPEYKLVVAANRDEFYNRNTAPAAFWEDHPFVLAGRDLEAQGTWMGMTKTGKVAMLTNYRDPANISPTAPSRGRLVSDYLEGHEDAAAYSKAVEAVGHRYNGFNLLVGDVDSLFYTSNYRKGVTQLGKGVYGLSNHLLDTPWPKVARGKATFHKLIQSPFNAESLFGFLYDDQRAADDQLPETGIGLERERALSAMFIKTSNYGSRCSTVILVDKQNQVYFSERVYDVPLFSYKTRDYSFKVESTHG